MAFAMGRTPTKDKQEEGEWKRGKQRSFTKMTPPPPPSRQTPEVQPIPSPPIETKYQSRLTEAKAMMAKVKIQLGNSRNTSRIIIKEVTEAAERLVQIVRESEAERKTGTKKETQPREKQVPEEEEMNERILEKIEVNTRMLQENEKRMNEMKKLIEEQKERVEKATYANIVIGGRKPQEKEMKERKTLHSIAVTSQDDQETGEEVLERVRRAVEAKEGWTKVERVRKAKDRKIIIGCNTKEERENIKNKIEKAGQRLVVEDMKNKDPLLVLKSVLSMHTDEEVVRALKNQNREVFHGLDDEENRIEIKYRKRTKNPHTNHIVVTVSPTIWGRATERGRLKVDLQNVFVEDQSPLVQCSRCLGYGHGRRFCKASVEALCSHCGGPHLRIDCPGKVLGETPECVNCKRAGREETGHNAFSKDCPVRRKWDGMARASIQYC